MPAVRVAPELSGEAMRFIGQWAFRDAPGDTFFDFLEVSFGGDGRYEAKVEATLVNAAVRSFGARCTLPEEGTWNVYRVMEHTRMRLRPSTGRARVYILSGEGTASDPLVLARRGGSSALVRRSAERHGASLQGVA